MRSPLRQVIDAERGAELVGWVAMTVITFFMIVGIWVALFGGAGSGLKAEIGHQVERYANGFEGGLGTSGPTAGEPVVNQGPLPPRQEPVGATMQGARPPPPQPAPVFGMVADAVQQPPIPSLYDPSLGVARMLEIHTNADQAGARIYASMTAAVAALLLLIRRFLEQHPLARSQ